MPESDQKPEPQPTAEPVEANFSVNHPKWPKKVNITECKVEDLKLIRNLLDIGSVHPTGR